MVRIAEALVVNETRLRTAWGDSLPALGPHELDTLRGGPAGARPANLPSWAPDASGQVLPRLAAAFRRTGDEAFALAAHQIYAGWLEREPVEKGSRPDYGNPLLIPHRLGDTECVGWFGALPEFCASALFDELFLARLVESARLQLNYMVDRLHEGRNIRMTQSDCLLTHGMRLSWLPDAARWFDVGRRAMNDAFHRQFHPDGSSVEATGWYHFIVMNMAHRYWRLKQAIPELGLQVTARQVGAAWDYLVALVQPDGELSRIGDCTAALPLGGTLRAALERRADVRRELGLPDAAPPLTQFFTDARQVFLREHWGPDATCISFDATRCLGWHWHPARNAIQLHAGGRRVLCDPGRMSYSPTPQRCWAVTTPAHGTLSLNGWSQSDADATVSVRRAGGCDVVASCYDGGYWPATRDGYGPGIYARHHRTLLWVRGRFLLVIDYLYHTAEEGAKPRVESHWQFAPGTVEIDGDRIVSRHGDVRLLMTPALKPAGMTVSSHEGELDPCCGWVADAGDRPVPAPHLTFSVDRYDPWRFDMATLLVPCVDGEPPALTLEEPTMPEDAGFGRVAFAWPDGARDEVLWKRGLEYALGEAGGLRTDAALVHVETGPRGALRKAFVYEGSYLEPHTSAWRPAVETFTIEG